MRRIHAGILVGAVTWTLAAMLGPLAEPASAQVFDHLKCYRVKDSRNTSHDPVTLTPKLPPFAVEAGCTFNGHRPRAKFVCTPVNKNPNNLGPGLDLVDNYLCYNVRCPREASDVSVPANDQLGSGTVTARRRNQHRLVCVPEDPGGPTPTPPPTPTPTPTPPPTPTPTPPPTPTPTPTPVYGSAAQAFISPAQGLLDY